MPLHCRLATLLALFFASAAGAAPFTPTSDSQVLETLPARATDPRMREMHEMRAALRREPRNLELAVQLARRYYEEVAAEGDPRYIGYAQAALAPWWQLPEPPPAARVLRAMLLQFNHDFAGAVADLDGALKVEPANTEAWAWRAAISMVQADYPAARHACQQLGGIALPLVAVTCTAYVDSVTGKADAASAAIRTALQRAPDAPASARLWVLTRLAEIEERRGDYKAAEAAFREALALGLSDGYLLAAYADFLLDRGRAAEVMALLGDKTRSDVLLVRAALAAKALAIAAAARAVGRPRRRVSRRHSGGATRPTRRKSRALRWRCRAGPRKRSRWRNPTTRVQREPADARALLEAAIAARQPAAAAPALKWMAESGIDSLALKNLAARLKGAA